MQVPVELGRDDARRAAREELSKLVYRDAGPGLLERVIRWLLDRLGKLLDGAAGVSPGGYAGLVVVLLLVVVAVVAFRLGLGPMRRSDTGDAPLFVGGSRTAAEHRASADAHAAAQQWAEAVRDRLRAVITSLEERALLEPRPGRTADEAAADAGQAVPDCADDLRAAARLFDEIWYGDHPARREHDATMRALDERVLASRPRSAHAPPVATGVRP
jgi:hypothetical protein